VVGHSYGGATVVRLALRRPGLVRSLVLVEPMLATLLREAGDPLFGEYRTMAEGFVRHARAGREGEAWALFLDYRNGPGTWAAMAEKARARFLGQTAQTVEGFLSNLSNPTTLDDCRRITVPTTVVCGGETTAPDRRVTEQLREAIPGCRYATIPGAGHMSPLTHPEELARIVLDHLGPGGAGAARPPPDPDPGAAH
jgi:pimeloyl-ACP methyl ester carboxylesterase